MQFSLNKKISDKTSQNKDLSQHCFVQWQRAKIRGPQKILCTFGEKEHTSKRVNIIACNNVISKAQCAPCGRVSLLLPYFSQNKDLSQHCFVQWQSALNKFYVILRSKATWESPGRESALYEVCNAFFHKVSVPGDASHTALLKSHYCKQ